MANKWLHNSITNLLLRFLFINDYYTLNNCIFVSVSFEIDKSPPSDASLDLAEKELRETPENIRSALAELRELLKNDDDIYFKDDDETLTIFLRPCKWYAKSAYELVSSLSVLLSCSTNYLMYKVYDLTLE